MGAGLLRHLQERRRVALGAETVEQARRRQLADIISQLHDGVLAIDTNQNIWLANHAMCEITGVPESAGLFPAGS